jgi:RNA polymerase sigma factor for flagellar operon FliA
MEITREHWREYRRTKDPRLREILITAHISLVRHIAGRLSLHLPSHVETDELESAGVVGLLSSVESYDPEQGVEFASFAQHRIRGAILDDLRSRDLAPRSLRTKAREIEQTLFKLEGALGRQPSDDEVAAALGMGPEAYWQQLSEIRGPDLVSLDEPATDADGPQGARSKRELPDPDLRDPFTATASRERVQLLGKIIDTLPTQERLVLTLYYFEELTMREIGRVLEVSESRISQIHTSAILRMRARLLRAKLQRDDLVLEDRVFFTARELVMAILVSLGVLLAGCAAPSSPASHHSIVIPRHGRVVVIPRSASVEDRPLAEAVARLFVLEMSGSRTEVEGLDWLREQARSRGWDVPLGSLVEDVALPDRDARPPLIDWGALGVTSVLVVSVFGVDQYWEETARVTRVGVEARLISLPSGDLLWAGSVVPASAGMTGWSFEHATRVAVRKLAERLK